MSDTDFNSFLLWTSRYNWRKKVRAFGTDRFVIDSETDDHDWTFNSQRDLERYRHWLKDHWDEAVSLGAVQTLMCRISDFMTLIDIPELTTDDKRRIMSRSKIPIIWLERTKLKRKRPWWELWEEDVPDKTIKAIWAGEVPGYPTYENWVPCLALDLDPYSRVYTK